MRTTSLTPLILLLALACAAADDDHRRLLLSAAVVGVLITIWLVPMITTTSYVPFFVPGAALVPAAVLSVWALGGRIEPVQSN